MFRIACEEWTIGCSPEGLPAIYGAYREHAALAEEFGLERTDGECCFVGVQRGLDWPFLTVAQRCTPTPSQGFCPGALVVPETRLLFLGAGTRLLAYRLDGPERIWQDTADIGFWGWQRHGEFVVMSAEIEMAAWGIDGVKIWSTYVEPPWEYLVHDGIVHLDVMGSKLTFPIASGPLQ